MSSLIVTFAIHCAVNDDIKEILCISVLLFTFRWWYRCSKITVYVVHLNIVKPAKRNSQVNLAKGCRKVLFYCYKLDFFLSFTCNLTSMNLDSSINRQQWTSIHSAQFSPKHFHLGTHDNPSANENSPPNSKRILIGSWPSSCSSSFPAGVLGSRDRPRVPEVRLQQEGQHQPPVRRRHGPVSLPARGGGGALRRLSARVLGLLQPGLQTWVEWGRHRFQWYFY